MGNSFGCGGNRSHLKKSLTTQVKLLEILDNVTLQEYELKIKKFARNGLITQKQLAEILSYHQLRSRNNTLLMDILQNPFFHASQQEIKRAERLDKKSKEEEES